jgi:hypothetical protein
VNDAWLALLLVVATAVGSFGGSWFGIKLSTNLSERQLRYSRQVDAVIQLSALVYGIRTDLWTRANKDEITMPNREERSRAVSAKLNQLSSWQDLYSPWLSPNAAARLKEVSNGFVERHVSLSNALLWNTMNDPGDARSVEAVKGAEKVAGGRIATNHGGVGGGVQANGWGTLSSPARRE